MLIIVGLIVAIGLTILFYFQGSPWWALILEFCGSFIGVIVVFVLSAGLFTLILGKKDVPLKPRKIFRFYIKYACEFVNMLFNIRVSFEGRELLETEDCFKSGKYMLVSNHQSIFDPIVLINSTKLKKLAFIMKKGVLNIPLVGRFLYSSGFIPLDRSSTMDGLRMVLKAAAAVKTGEHPIGIFVEGTRSKNRKIGDFHDGSFKIATKGESDIVVLVLDNTRTIKKGFCFKRANVLVKICKVIKYEDIKNLSTKEISLMVRNIMEENLKEVREKYEFLEM